MFELGNGLQEKDNQSGEKENELQYLRAAITCLLNPLTESVTVVMQAEEGFQQRLDPLNFEIATSKSRFGQFDETISANPKSKKFHSGHR